MTYILSEVCVWCDYVGIKGVEVCVCSGTYLVSVSDIGKGVVNDGVQVWVWVSLCGSEGRGH